MNRFLLLENHKTIHKICQTDRHNSSIRLTGKIDVCRNRTCVQRDLFNREGKTI